MITINPCSDCESLDNLHYALRTNILECKACGKQATLDQWDDMSPLPEPDPLAVAHEQLAECYDLLDGIVGTSDYVEWDIRESAKALLAKHRSENNG